MVYFLEEVYFIREDIVSNFVKKIEFREIYDPDGKPRVSRADKGVWLHDRFDQNTQSSRRRERRKKSEVCLDF